MLSIEAAAAFAVLISIILGIAHNQQYNAENIFITQKMDDLLIIWARSENNIAEMAEDARLLFGENNFEIGYGGELVGKIRGQKISRKIRVLPDSGDGTISLSVEQQYFPA